jgi:hypothetical protein
MIEDLGKTTTDGTRLVWYEEMSNLGLDIVGLEAEESPTI